MVLGYCHSGFFLLWWVKSYSGRGDGWNRGGGGFPFFSLNHICLWCWIHMVVFMVLWLNCLGKSSGLRRWVWAYVGKGGGWNTCFPFSFFPLFCLLMILNWDDNDFFFWWWIWYRRWCIFHDSGGFEKAIFWFCLALVGGQSF